MKTIRGIFYKFFSNTLACFWKFNFIWYLVAIILTYLIVISGFDWTYYTLFHHGLILSLLMPATFLGFLIPLFLPIILLIKGAKNSIVQNAGYAVAQAEILGWLVSTFLKSLTGRFHPEVFTQSTIDISHIFQFGFLRGGIFWGWPSSHTTVAFAFAFTLLMLFPESKKIKFLALFYAFYVGLGVSVSIHWFSDFVAGAIIGTIIGITVGRVFKKKLELA